MKLAFLTALVVCPLAAQTVDIGAIGGVNLTPDVSSGSQSFTSTYFDGVTRTDTYTSEALPPRPMVGLKLEIGFGRRFSIEVDAIRREVRARSRSAVSPPLQFPDGTLLGIFPTTTRTLTPWEFPLLAKYRFTNLRFRPFLTAGPSFRPAGSGTGLSHVGVTAGAGIELRAGGFRFEPGIRYTRWHEPRSFNLVGEPKPDQVEFLIGVDRPSVDNRISVFGQPVRFGFITGIGLGTDFKVSSFDTDRRPERNSGIFGVSIEARVWRDLSVEVDGLYRPLHGSEPEFDHRVRFAHLIWEFPVLARYRLPAFAGSRYRPVIEGGPSFRAEGNLNLRPVSHYGATFGSGIEASVAKLRIMPMVRYTRWSNGNTNSGGAHTHNNQIQILFSFSF